MAAESGTRMVRSALLPHLSMGASAERRGITGDAARTDTDLRASVAVDQLIYSGGRVTAAVEESAAAQSVVEA